jgi:asparagine synthetase B (glutamine-hydrolysing)
MERAWQRLAVTRVDASCAAELHDEGLSLPDDPILTPLALLPARMLLWSRAREDGIQTIIEGEGGDELFGILPTPLDALRRGHLVDAVVQVVRSSGRRSLAQNGLFLPWLPEVVQRSWLASRQPLEAHLPAFSLWEAHQHPAVREAVLQHLATLVHRPFPESVNEWLSAPAFVGATLTRRHFAASVGLELAWPMLDRPVLELLLGLHAAGALRGGPQKPFLQAALAGVVPDPVRTAEKNTGLYEAFIRRILASPRSREALRDARVRRRLSGLVRFERIDAMLDGLAQGRSLGPAPLWQLECVVSFARWYARASRELGVD